MDEKEYCIIRGTVEQIRFYNADNSYAVLRLMNEEGAEVTATGLFPNIGVGEQVVLTGRWVTHPTYGEQFASEAFDRRLPASASGIAEYLGSGIIRGVGPRLASRIVDKFGEKTFEILENNPERLTALRGINERKAREISRQFIEQNEMRSLMTFLQENNLPISLTSLLYKRLQNRAISALKENPYLLCDSYYDIDFKVADELAMRLGLSLSSDERTDAAALYTLSYNLNNGHTFIPLEKLVKAVCTLLSDDTISFEEDPVLNSLERLAQNKQLIKEHIANRDVVYLETIYRAETYLAAALNSMAERNFEYNFSVDELLEALTQDNNEISFSEKQRQAIFMAAQHGLVILTGGPGTGKTTTVHGILQIFDALGLHTLLAAPTGRAAKRLNELTDREAKTIHRLLESNYQVNGHTMFIKNHMNQLDCDAVILDEVSMIDITLMQALVEALPSHARLVLVGDADQLPPVGPGNVLRDIINSQCIPTIQLTQIFRQAQKSNIVLNAHAVNAGQMPTASQRDGDFFFLKRIDTASVIETVVELCAKRLPNYYGFTFSQIQVLSPAKRQGSGTIPLNRKLQEALNPPSEHKREKRFGDMIFREGDRVMQVRNNYDIIWERGEEEVGAGIFNGDTGEILQIIPQQECMRVQFDDRIAVYTFDMLNELELAYAITVHKSQGSEFDAVVLALSESLPRMLLTRSILYTAITRAKKLLVIVGSPNILANMIENNRQSGRYSALKLRLKQLGSSS